LSNHDAILGEQSTNLIDLGDAITHQQASDAVHALNVLLLDAIDSYIAHCRAGSCLDDCLGIIAVVLLRFDKRLHELRSNHLNLVSHRHETTRPVVSATTCFQGNSTGREANYCL